jgi:hypothetical protein
MGSFGATILGLRRGVRCAALDDLAAKIVRSGDGGSAAEENPKKGKPPWVTRALLLRRFTKDRP